MIRCAQQLGDGQHYGQWPHPRIQTDSKHLASLSFRLERRLERKTGADLYLPAWSSSRRNGSKLRRVDKPVRSAQVYFVQCIKSFHPKLEPSVFGNRKISAEGKIQSQHTRSSDGVAADIAEGVRRRRSECQGVEPLLRRTRTRTKNRLTGVVSTDRVLAKNCA